MTFTRLFFSPLPLVLGLAGLALAGCSAASVPWHNPSVSPEQTRHDYYACRRQAERDSGWREESASSPFRDYDRQQAKGIADASLKACMVGLGYQPLDRAAADRPKPAAP
ncbi:MAG: hypothetical protein RLZZ501_471 [Pseudomonadota bacterium]|jgi:hypothetical protein